MEMMIANICAGVVLMILGLIIQTGKANFLIAGYNTKSKEEQDKWDMAVVSKFLGWVVLVAPSAVLLLACIPIALDVFPHAALILSWIIFTVVMVVGVVYVNFSPRFKRTDQACFNRAGRRLYFG